MIFAVWFSSTPVEHNKLGNVVSKMCKDVDLQGQFSNHSLRDSTATRELEKAISDKLIMERTAGPPRYQILTRRFDISPKLRVCKALNCRSEESVGEREAEPR